MPLSCLVPGANAGAELAFVFDPKLKDGPVDVEPAPNVKGCLLSDLFGVLKLTDEIG